MLTYLSIRYYKRGRKGKFHSFFCDTLPYPTYLFISKQFGEALSLSPLALALAPKQQPGPKKRINTDGAGTQYAIFNLAPCDHGKKEITNLPLMLERNHISKAPFLTL